MHVGLVLLELLLVLIAFDGVGIYGDFFWVAVLEDSGVVDRFDVFAVEELLDGN